MKKTTEVRKAYPAQRDDAVACIAAKQLNNVTKVFGMDLSDLLRCHLSQHYRSMVTVVGLRLRPSSSLARYSPSACHRKHPYLVLICMLQGNH